MRPGPKTRLEDVKTAIIQLLRDNPEGLNFNAIFRRLKKQKMLGSFSVLTRAMKDLREAGVVKYKDVEVPRYKIPKRIYTLSDPMEHMLKQQYVREKEKVPLKDIVSKETLLRHLFLTRMNNLVAVYRDLLHEENPSDENARWKLILNLELEYMRAFMDAVAKGVSEGKIPSEEAGKVAYEVHKRITRVL